TAARHDLGVHDAHVIGPTLRVGWFPRHLQAACWVAPDRSAQIRALRALANPAMNRIMKRATDPMHVLPHLEKDNGDTAVLADRHPLDRRHLIVPHQLFERATSE